MSNWKVSKEKIELFAHPNADSLMVGKVGSYQVVVQKGLYSDGDEVVFAPEKSVSGQGLHIREGVVLRPYLDRDSTDGTKLRLKIINPSYKESGEEFN